MGFCSRSLLLYIILIIGQSKVSAQYTQFGSKLVGTGYSTISGVGQGYSICLSGNGQTLAVGANTDSAGVGAVWVYTLTGSNWVQVGKKLVANDGKGVSNQGTSVSLSENGQILAVGGSGDSSGMGATWIYIYSAGKWSQLGKKLVGTYSNPYGGLPAQGSSVSLTSDGNTLAVGGSAGWIFTFTGSNWIRTNTISSGIGNISGDGKSLFVANSKGFFVYTFSGGNWSQAGQALVGSGVLDDYFGSSSSISYDGKTIAVGASQDSVTVNGGGVGAVWLFTLTGGNWVKMGKKLVGQGATYPAAQGTSVSLSGDGKTVAFGGPYDDYRGGSTWVFTLSGGNWSQVGNKLIGISAVGNAAQGSFVSISNNGQTLATSGIYDRGSLGAVWVFGNGLTTVTGIGNLESYPNTIKIFPNPTQDQITVTFENYNSLSGYSLKIVNSLGSLVYSTNITQQQSYISLSNLGGSGLYFMYVKDCSGNIIDVKKIILQ